VHNVGVLELVPVHRPEARTKLVPLGTLSQRSSASSRGAAELATSSCDEEFPTRLLAEPLPLSLALGPKPTVTIENHLFSVEEKSHPMRFDAVDWWTSSPMCRDYARVLLTSATKSLRAWIFTDRTTGRSFLHGYFD
jgi:protein ImuB